MVLNFAVRRTNGRAVGETPVFNARSAIAALFALLVVPAALANIYLSPNPSSGNYTVSWDPWPGTNLARYELYESVDGGASFPLVYSGTTASKVYAGKPAGAYVYKVNVCFYVIGTNVSCMWDGYPTPTQVTETVVSQPPVPGAINAPATDSDGAYSISWGASSGATSYELQEKVGAGAWATIQNTAALTASFTGKGEATYSYQVRACNGSVCSAFTAAASVVVSLVPGVPARSRHRQPTRMAPTRFRGPRLPAQ